eukprot:COSAG02_NODE_25913_length_645_cov_2.267399_1_plen_150_part_01
MFDTKICAANKSAQIALRVMLQVVAVVVWLCKHHCGPSQRVKPRPVPTKQMYRSDGQIATDRRHQQDPGRWRGEMARNVPQAGYTAVRIYSAQALDRLPFCHLAELEEGPRRTSDASWPLPPRRASERQRRSAQSFCALHECAAAPLRVP